MANLTDDHTVTTSIERDEDGVTRVTILVNDVPVAVAEIEARDDIYDNRRLGVPSYEVLFMGTRVRMPNDVLRGSTTIGQTKGTSGWVEVDPCLLSTAPS